VWADDGYEQLETVALGWTGRDVFAQMLDWRFQFTAAWLDAADVRRRKIVGCWIEASLTLSCLSAYLRLF
jgi:hypothetical protein